MSLRGPFLTTSLLLMALAASAQTHVVFVKDFEFNPKKIHIVQGDTVRWENRDIERGHSVQIRIPGYSESDKFYPDESYSLSFNEPGEYPYLCGYHPGMKGVVYVIVDPSKPPEVEFVPTPPETSVDEKPAVPNENNDSESNTEIK